MYAIRSDAHPDLMILAYTGDLSAEELLIDNALRLNEGRRKYILIDVSGMNNGLPDGFLETVQRSFAVHPQVGHLAVYTTSAVLRIAAGMVIKVVRLKDKATIHGTYESAYQQFVQAIAQDKLKKGFQTAHG